MTATSSRPTLQKLPSAYAAHLERLPISEHTRRSYGQAVTRVRRLVAVPAQA
ncbi:ABC-type bacteriocin/lantibiotic exporter with double-glycine peptidase domain [Nocardioides panzhihuensis]|uniref:ABC-type bacteriocin/lantibiotic exporter with double-glycine peptidase domain n=1 Tax=Nocardioides panzhihuensis TaxID=860243 RepID=A0A7Z0IVQ4_9ACTN|nr:ABC-type bacteriocin/lantibiotic exporter with double-glycine peptidase domain [Nocardioides panzhihuensis]